MVYNLIPPNESICVKVYMLKKYNILSFYNHKIPLEDQNIILALIRDFNIACVSDSFKDVFKVPIDIVNRQTRIDASFTSNNFEKGIDVITSILSQEDDTRGNLGETSKFKEKLKKTNDVKAFYIFSPQKQMFLEELHSDRYYMFYDILCNQYFQEYREDIHIEHLIPSIKLAYLCDYAVTTNDENEFQLILKILEFALISSFAQCRVTGTCNTSTGSKPRWRNTIDQYINILTFICKLYNCPNDTPMIHNNSNTTIKEYIEKMKENSNKIHNWNGNDEEFKTNYISKPTIILPKKSKTEQKLEGKDPLIHYDFDLSVRIIEEIGKLTNTKSNIIDCIFNKSGRVKDYQELNDLIGERVEKMRGYETIIGETLFRFGFSDISKEEKELLGKLPPVNIMVSRIKKIEDLIESNKPQSMFDRIIQDKINDKPKKIQVEQKGLLKKIQDNKKIAQTA